MLWSLKNLLEYTILTTDGKHEHVITTLFDEATWELRYLIVQTGSFSPTPVMIALTALNAPNQVARVLPIELTTQQVKNSPTIVMNMLMTPSTQKRLNECYALFQYWALSGYASSSLPLALISAPEIRQPETTIFRDTHDVLRMMITTTDGNSGTVDDLIIDDSMWKVQYLIFHDKAGSVNNTAWIPPELMTSVNWQKHTMRLGVSIEHVRTALKTQPQGEQL